MTKKEEVLFSQAVALIEQLQLNNADLRKAIEDKDRQIADLSTILAAQLDPLRRPVTDPVFEIRPTFSPRPNPGPIVEVPTLIGTTQP